MERPQPISVRTLLVSDVHLGCKHSRANEFLHFLQGFSPQTLYLVGDFLDAWKINRGWHWSADCDRVIGHLMELVSQGTKIHYVPGNHDSFLRTTAYRDVLDDRLSGVEVADEFVLDTARGWQLLVTHGDRFDLFETRTPWLSKGVSALYDACLSVNWWIHRMRLDSHRNPYGACAFFKDRVKRWIRFISRFETKIMEHARQRSCDGVVCGHIHTPDISYGKAMWYCNTGDWVENCTGLVEYHSGQFCLIRRYEPDLVLDLPTRISTQHPVSASSALESGARETVVAAG